MVIEGAGLGVISTPPALKLKETVNVPETVPVCSASGTLLTGAVAPAGTVKLAVVPPDANWMVLSVGPEFGEKVRIAVPKMSTGYALPSETRSGYCCAGLAVAGRPEKVIAGAAG